LVIFARIFAHFKPSALTAEQFYAQFLSRKSFWRGFLLKMISILSIPQIEKELGKRLKRRRLEMNLSQEEISERSGLARRTITAIENGEGSTLTTLIAMLRALDALDILEDFLPDTGPSPMAMLKLQEEPRKYASKPRRSPPPTPWKWGDER
jgi:transcriptional regulator with XRE-family HTH domain